MSRFALKSTSALTKTSIIVTQMHCAPIPKAVTLVNVSMVSPVMVLKVTVQTLQSLKELMNALKELMIVTCLQRCAKIPKTHLFATASQDISRLQKPILALSISIHVMPKQT